MAIQRGIALSGRPETTADLTLSQGSSLGATRVCTAGEERRLGPSARVCWAGLGGRLAGQFCCPVLFSPTKCLTARHRSNERMNGVGGTRAWPDPSTASRGQG